MIGVAAVWRARFNGGWALTIGMDDPCGNGYLSVRRASAGIAGFQQFHS
jgi:hypothetical protein